MSQTASTEPTGSRLNLLQSMEHGEPHSTGEVAELSDTPRRTAFKWLDELAESGHVSKKKLNQTTCIWIRVQ
jgi:DNA-binding IclR family transcriptional regulator